MAPTLLAKALSLQGMMMMGRMEDVPVAPEKNTGGVHKKKGNLK